MYIPIHGLIKTELVSDSVKKALIKDFKGVQDTSLRKKETARTYKLSDGRILVEFFDKQAVTYTNYDDFKKAETVTFFKNDIWFLKKNITYKISSSVEEASLLSQYGGSHLKQYTSNAPDFHSLSVYKIFSGQVLVIYDSEHWKYAFIYENIKAVASEIPEVFDKEYSSMEVFAEKFIEGDPLLDFEPNEHFIYPDDEKKLIDNHKLQLIESKVYIDEFYSNLYKSDSGYYILIEDFSQVNPHTNKPLIIGTAYLFETLDEVRNAQKRYEETKDSVGYTEHFYQQISNKHGKDFPKYVDQLIDLLPSILNIDKEQLTINSAGIEVLDAAIEWNHSNYQLFDLWFPSVLAFYGQCIINDRKDGTWVTKYDAENKVWIPWIILKDNKPAFDVLDFYNDLYESPVDLKWAGNWDGMR